MSGRAMAHVVVLAVFAATSGVASAEERDDRGGTAPKDEKVGEPHELVPPSISSREPVAQEPITDAIVAGVVLTVFGQVAAGSLVMTTTPILGCSSPAGHGPPPGCAAGSWAPPEALVPLVGPFVALGRHGDLMAGYQAVLGIAGALQIVGLAAIVAGGTIERPVERPLNVSIDAGPQSVRLELIHSW